MEGDILGQPQGRLSGTANRDHHHSTRGTEAAGGERPPRLVFRPAQASASSCTLGPHFGRQPGSAGSGARFEFPKKDFVGGFEKSDSPPYKPTSVLHIFFGLGPSRPPGPPAGRRGPGRSPSGWAPLRGSVLGAPPRTGLQGPFRRPVTHPRSSPAAAPSSPPTPPSARGGLCEPNGPGQAPGGGPGRRATAGSSWATVPESWPRLPESGPARPFPRAPRPTRAGPRRPRPLAALGCPWSCAGGCWGGGKGRVPASYGLAPKPLGAAVSSGDGLPRLRLPGHISVYGRGRPPPGRGDPPGRVPGAWAAPARRTPARGLPSPAG